MLTTARILASLAILWMLFLLVYQLVRARGTGRRDYSARAGDTIRGMLYNFTWAMLPSHKETVRLHPFEFTVGVLMHIGIFIAIAKALILIIVPAFNIPISYVLVILLGISVFCAIWLLMRRIISLNLRFMSNPDDYVSIVLSLVFMLSAIAQESGFIDAGVFLIVSAIVFFYLPLGKLKHALFFFVARADYGARLGYRGTYPVRNGGSV